MNRIPRIAIALSIAVAAALCVSVCRSGSASHVPTVFAAVAAAQDQAPPDQGQPDQGPDPAAGTWRPADRPTLRKLRRPTNLPISRARLPMIPVTLRCRLNRQQSRRLPLPDYDQPPAPGDGYIWTPGYWAWGAAAILLGARRVG